MADPEVIPSESVREEYENLVDLVRKYRFAYYQEDAPLVSDAEFDELFRRLEEADMRILDDVDFGRLGEHACHFGAGSLSLVDQQNPRRRLARRLAPRQKLLDPAVACGRSAQP